MNIYWINQNVNANNKAKKINAIYFEKEHATQPSEANLLASHSSSHVAHVSFPLALMQTISLVSPVTGSYSV